MKYQDSRVPFRIFLLKRRTNKGMIYKNNHVHLTDWLIFVLIIEPKNVFEV